MNAGRPDISIVMPCYNEEVAIQGTAPEIIDTFRREGVAIQLVLVDNGSTDRTGEIIDKMIDTGYPIKKIYFEKNQGYAGGILGGLKNCDAPIIGYLCADGQVSAEDCYLAYRLILGREDRILSKVRRRFRKDSIKRKIVSVIYNGMMHALYGGLGAIDINGSPKIFSKHTFEAMNLVSRDWFLDPEIIVKAKYLGLRVIEIDVEGNARRGGASNVNMGTIGEFLKNIFQYRFGGSLKEWKQHIESVKNLEGLKRTEAVYEHDADPRPAGVPSEDPRYLDLGIIVIKQKRVEDERGFVQKVLTESQYNGTVPRGEVYVTSAKQGESKGNHYHMNMGEWFTVVQGEGQLDIQDPESGETMSLPLGVSDPRTVYVPAGIAHAVTNKGKDVLICIAWAEREHDPSDVFPCQVAH
jgi:glycosyltransferase involved in cell wall biosynthesis/dTDP-4-dehydrorhamnose 3,5-epimerase-like enzyme